MWNQGPFPNPTYLKFSNNGCQNFKNQSGDNSLIEDHLESQAGRISLWEKNMSSNQVCVFCLNPMHHVQTNPPQFSYYSNYYAEEEYRLMKRRHFVNSFGKTQKWYRISKYSFVIFEKTLNLDELSFYFILN